MQEKYSTRPERRGRLIGSPAWERPVSTQRRWVAVLAGTAVSIVAFSLLANAIVEAGDGHQSGAALSAAGATAAVGVLLVVVGFVSRAASPWRSAAVWEVASIVLFVGGAFAAREAATGYVLAVGAAVAWVMRFEDGTHVRAWRLWTVVGLAAYTKTVYLLSPSLAILAAPLLPVAGIAIIDSVAERRRGGQSPPLA